ncbi:unnamed protein product [Spodoptera exigua]|nr:unnamed protein product [Spodoptera exigua]
MDRRAAGRARRAQTPTILFSSIMFRQSALHRLVMYLKLALNTKDMKCESKIEIYSRCYDCFDRDQPFTFQIGVGQVIKGWDQGLLDMCVGRHRVAGRSPTWALLVPYNSACRVTAPILGSVSSADGLRSNCFLGIPGDRG